MFHPETRTFEFRPGPVFTQVVLADEINRATPKVQSALLEVMEEGQVTVGGVTRPVDPFFLVVATQNPLEQEGTYPLPEAQLDRFLMQINVGYPDLDSERRMLIATTGTAEPVAKPVMAQGELAAAQALIRRIPVGATVVEAILRLVREGRPETTSLEMVRNHVAWGPGPRAAQSLMLAARARAVLQGRLSPSMDDVAALAHPILRHRMALNFAARADGVRVENVIERLIGGASA